MVLYPTKVPVAFRSWGPEKIHLLILRPGSLWLVNEHR